MSWKDQNAIKRIFNTFKRVKPQIYSQDIEALKQVAESIESSQSGYVNDNMLYAKLLAVVLRQNMELYGTMKFAIKDVNTILSQPLENHLHHLTDSLNRKTEIEYLKNIGFKLDNITNDTDYSLLKDNQKEIVVQLKKSWSYDNVSKSFYNTANDLLKDINNYQ